MWNDAIMAILMLMARVLTSIPATAMVVQATTVVPVITAANRASALVLAPVVAGNHPADLALPNGPTAGRLFNSRHYFSMD